MLTVIIPTYKPQEYLWECLGTIAKQTLSKDRFEVLLVLNGCCEPYRTDIEQYITREMAGVNICLIQTDEGGVSNARNIGLDQARGEYITFIDDDDYISPCYFEALLDKAMPDTVVLSNSISFVDGSSDFDENYSIRKAYYNLKKRQVIDLFHARTIFNGPCMKLFPRSFIQEHRFNKRYRNGEDSLFMFEISYHISKLILADEVAVYYRRYRIDSATTCRQSFREKSSVVAHMIWEYTKNIMKNPFSFNCLFVLSRYAAELKSLIR